MVCHGQGCLVTFTNVHFSDCHFVVLAGAKVLFQDCTFTFEGSGKESKTLSKIIPAFFVHGLNTGMSVCKCVVDGKRELRTGIVAQQGASAELENCSVLSVTYACVEVHGENSTVNADSSSFAGEGVADCLSYGVLVHEGAHARVFHACMADMGVGFMAKNGANLVIEEAMVQGTWFTGVLAISDSNVKLLQCRIHDAYNVFKDSERQWLQGFWKTEHMMGCAVCVEDHSQLTAVRCEMKDNSRAAVLVKEHSIVRVSECKSHNNAKGGFIAVLGAMLHIRDCFSSGDGDALQLQRCGSCCVENMTAQNCQVGFHVLSPEGEVLLNRCSAKQYGEGALRVKYEGEVVRMYDCHVGPGTATATGVENPGIRVSEGGQLLVSNCTLQCNTVGVMVLNPGSRMQMLRCKVSAWNVGVEVQQDARMKLIDCEASGCKEGGFGVNARAVASITNCASVNCDTGLRSHGGTTSLDGFRAEGCYLGATFGGVQHPAPTTVTVHHSTFTSSHKFGCGMVVRGSTCTADVRDCKFTQSEVVNSPSASQLKKLAKKTSNGSTLNEQGRQGMLVTDSGKASVKSCTFLGHRSWAILNRGGDVEVHRCHTARNEGAYVLEQSGTMRVTNCSSFFDRIGLHVYGPQGNDAGRKGQHQLAPVPEFFASEVLVQRAQMDGFAVSGNVRCELRNCCALHCARTGMSVVNGPGSDTFATHGEHVRVVDSVFKRNAAGVLLNDKALAKFTNVDALLNRGPGFWVSASGTKMVLKCCKSSRNKRPYERGDGAVLESYQCTPEPSVVYEYAQCV